MLRYGLRLSVSVATFLLSLALSAALSLLPSASPRGGSAFEQEVSNANRAYLEAHIKHDVPALERLLADEFTIGGSYRRVGTKAQRLMMVSDADFFRYSELGEPRVTAGESAGEVSGRAVVHSSYMGREFASPPYYYSRKFEKRDGRWQVVSVEIFRVSWE